MAEKNTQGKKRVKFYTAIQAAEEAGEFHHNAKLAIELKLYLTALETAGFKVVKEFDA